MLPFLKPKKISSVIIASRKKDGTVMPEHEEGENDAGLMAAAEDLISAVHSKDSSAVASALKAAFEIMEEMPHEEGPHLNEE